MNGWFRDINKLFGIPAEKIGLLQGTEWRIGECVTVAMRQTLMNRFERFQELWSKIGMIIVDEVHIMPCNSMTGILDTCPAKYRIGITATPSRKDGLEKVLFLYFGKPFFTQSIEQEATTTSLPIKDAILVPTSFFAEYGEDNTKFVDQLTKDPERNELIVAQVKEEMAKNERCLVVTSRREHAENLVNMIGPSADLLLGAGDKRESRRIYEKYVNGDGKCLVSIYQLIYKGANLPSLSRLFITVPFANSECVIQMAGRIRRKFDGKTDCLIYDFYDQRIPGVRNVFRRYHIPAFREMKVQRWLNQVML